MRIIRRKPAVSNMHPILKLATKNALEHDYDPRLGYNLCAVIVRGGSVISVGYNSITKNSFVDSLSNYDNSTKGFINKHAEISAILSARAKTDLTGCKIYVSRIKPSGGVGMARPCNICQAALARYGIRRAYYTISNNEFGVMNLQSSSDVIHNLQLLKAV